MWYKEGHRSTMPPTPAPSTPRGAPASERLWRGVAYPQCGWAQCLPACSNPGHPLLLLSIILVRRASKGLGVKIPAPSLINWMILNSFIFYPLWVSVSSSAMWRWWHSYWIIWRLSEKLWLMYLALHLTYSRRLIGSRPIHSFIHRLF